MWESARDERKDFLFPLCLSPPVKSRQRISKLSLFSGGDHTHVGFECTNAKLYMYIRPLSFSTHIIMWGKILTAGEKTVFRSRSQGQGKGGGTFEWYNPSQWLRECGKIGVVLSVRENSKRWKMIPFSFFPNRPQKNSVFRVLSYFYIGLFERMRGTALSVCTFSVRAEEAAPPLLPLFLKPTRGGFPTSLLLSSLSLLSASFARDYFPLPPFIRGSGVRQGPPNFPPPPLPLLWSAGEEEEEEEEGRRPPTADFSFWGERSACKSHCKF